MACRLRDVDWGVGAEGLYPSLSNTVAAYNTALESGRQQLSTVSKLDHVVCIMSWTCFRGVVG